jgi:16S rRNA (uracil1498-N3)-methyltransferase
MPGPLLGPALVPATAHTYADRLDDRIDVGGDAGHHLHRVRRIRPGEQVTVADGAGRWRLYRVATAAEGVVSLDAESGVEHEVVWEPSVEVACALAKGDRPEVVVQKLTELGADRILFFHAERSVVRWEGHRAASAIARFSRVAREAGAQSRRARLPVVDGPVPCHELAAHPGLVVAERGGLPVGEVPVPAGGAWLVVVGPEGGFTAAELEAFGAAPRLGVGPHVLRAETAAIAAASALAGRRRPVPA